MAAYRMTPARRAALEKAQAASARKRRKGSKSRTSRLVNRKTLAVAAVGSTILAANTAGQVAATRYRNDTDDIVKQHVIDVRYEALLEKKRREYEFLLKRIKKKIT